MDLTDPDCVNLTSIPVELIIYIVNFFNFDEKCKLRLVSKYFRITVELSQNDKDERAIDEICKIHKQFLSSVQPDISPLPVIINSGLERMRVEHLLSRWIAVFETENRKLFLNYVVPDDCKEVAIKTGSYDHAKVIAYFKRQLLQKFIDMFNTSLRDDTETLRDYFAAFAKLEYRNHRKAYMEGVKNGTIK